MTIRKGSRLATLAFALFGAGFGTVVALEDIIIKNATCNTAIPTQCPASCPYHNYTCTSVTGPTYGAACSYTGGTCTLAVRQTCTGQTQETASWCNCEIHGC